MSRDDFVSVGIHMKLSSCLVHLELAEEDMSGLCGAEAFEEGLAMSDSLQCLELSYCIRNGKGATALARGLGRNKSLHSLGLTSCELEDEDLNSVFDSLIGHPKMEVVNAPRNFCGVQGLTSLGALIISDSSRSSCHPCLRSLDLSHQHFDRPEQLSMGHLASSLSKNSSLVSLSLAFNKLSDDAFANALCDNNTLQELDLRANQIGDSGAVVLERN